MSNVLLVIKSNRMGIEIKCHFYYIHLPHIYIREAASHLPLL